MNQFFPLGLDAEGVFYSESRPQKRPFFDAAGTLVTLESLPDGSWPIGHMISDGVEYLYFTYFLSSAVHKWRLTETGRREAGIDADSGELIDFLKEDPADPDMAWLTAKLSPAGLQLRDGFAPPTNAFAALEYAVACAIAEGRLRDRLLAYVSAASVHAGGSAPPRGLSLFRHLRVPSAYRRPVALSFGEFDGVKSMWGHLESAGFGLNFDAVTELSERVLVECNRTLLPSLVRMRCEFSRDFNNPVCCAIRYDPGEESLEADDGRARTLHLVVPESLIASREFGASHRFTIGRMRYSLDLLLSHLLRFLDAADQKFTLRFCFSDEGMDGFISFDRPTHSSRKIVPDLYMLDDAKTANYFPVHDETRFKRAFRSKAPVLFWRGATTGSNMSSFADLERNPRVQACLAINNQLGELADCKLSRLVQLTADLDAAETYLRRVNLWAPVVRESEFALRQLYVDIPGNAASWGTFRKFLNGCAVLRPLPAKRELAYHRVLEPWRDYVPIREDFSDVGDVVRTLLANPDETAAIAYRGRKKVIGFLRSLSETIFESLRDAAFAVEPAESGEAGQGR